MTQTEYQRAALGESQADKILFRLKAGEGAWVSMLTLASFSGAYAVHSRVSDLRKRGHNIEHRNERAGRVVKSFYRLVPQDADSGEITVEGTLKAFQHLVNIIPSVRANQ